MSSPAEPASLTQATFVAMLGTMLSAIPQLLGAPSAVTAAIRQSALDAVACLRPRDPLELQLAMRVVNAHHTALHAFTCAARPGISPSLQLRHEGRALSFSRLMDQTMRELSRRQAGPVQRPVALPDVPQSAQVAAPAPAPAPQQPAPQPQQSAQPAKQATSQVPASRPAAPPTPRPGAPLTPLQEEQLRRDLAARAAAALPALAA